MRRTYLERLSKPMLEGLEADEAAAEGEEGLMDISPPFVADREAPEAIEPGERALDDPAVATQAVAGVDAFTRNADLDVATAQGGSAPRIVIALIRMEFDRPLASLSGGRLGRGDGIQQQLEDLRVVAIGSSQERGKREAAPLDHNMALRARFAPIRWIRADGVAPLLAGMLALSREARLQSMRSVSPRRSRSVWCSRSHTPASCQSRKRRQHVTPEPQPSSCGSISHGMPDLSTKMIPLKAARSETRGRPPLGLGGSGGSSGATRAHNSSLTRGVLMPQVYHAPPRF